MRLPPPGILGRIVLLLMVVSALVKILRLVLG